MKTIDHLSEEEKQHFIKCDCGEYLDMRDLSEVFLHQHADLPEPDWSHSIKTGQAKAYTKSRKTIGLN
jgi:hypothetical protein